MSGGGGSSSKKKEDDKVTGTTPYARAPSTQTFQPTLPGFQGMLAQQLGQGFGSGGGSGDLMAMLSGLYRPMDVRTFQEPVSTTAALFDKKVNAPIVTGSPYLDKLLMGMKVEDPTTTTTKAKT